MTNDTQGASEDARLQDLARRLERLEAKHDEPESWSKKVPTFISVLALLFSFGTTFVSYKRTTEQDIHSLRTELRGILQRLASLPKENLDAYERYKADPASFGLVSGFIAQENNLLSKQADETVTLLPADRVSSTDHFAVGVGLQNARNFDRAIKLFSRAADVATGLDDEVNALRYLANLLLVTGRVGDGRATFQRAADIFSKYRGFDNFTIVSTNALTELSWATSEANNGFVEQASPRIARAEQLVATLPPGQGTDIVRSQVAQVKNAFASGNAALNPLAAATRPTLSDPVISPSSIGSQAVPQPQSGRR